MFLDGLGRILMLLNSLFSTKPLSTYNSNDVTEQFSASQTTFSNVHEFSPPEVCARTCSKDEAPLYCYYKFTLEYYATMTAACDYCTPNNTNQLANTPECQCVLADGFERGMMSINRMLPGPSIQVCQNDRIIVDVENMITGVETAIHWHGLFQQNHQYYDGVPYLTQCPIHSDTTFRYQFIAQNPGTHFYHSHSGLQKIDGIYGSLIVRDPANVNPHASLYDEDLTTHVIMISDWMHEVAMERFPGTRMVEVGQTPDNVLINGRGRWTNTTSNEDVPYETFQVESGKRYRIRLIFSVAGACPTLVTIEGHDLTLIAQDGEYVEATPVNTIVGYSGERADFILNANQPVGSYWIQVRETDTCDDTRPNQLAILRYVGASETPESTRPTYDEPLESGIVYGALNATCDGTEANVVCASQLTSAVDISEKLYKTVPDKRIILPISFLAYTPDPEDLFEPDTYNRFMVVPGPIHVDALVDGISFKFPSVPPLSQNLSTGIQTCNGDNLPANCSTPCSCTHVYHLALGTVAEILLYDALGLIFSHPFHLHGHSFNVFKIGLLPDPTNVTQSDIDEILEEHDRMLEASQYYLPPRKDTIPVPAGGYAIIRFETNNPGWWYFHCHIMWHMDVGMDLVFHVGENKDLPPVPTGFPTCDKFQPDAFPNDKASANREKLKNRWEYNY